MAGEDRDRCKWVKTLACLAPGAPRGCSPVTEAHHAGRRGVGQKCPDAETVPLCSQHHADWESGWGAFRGWDQEQRRAFTAAALATTETRWQARRELPNWF